MKKSFLICLFFAIFLLFPQSYIADSEKENYIIYLNDHVNSEVIDQLNIEVVQEFEHIPALVISGEDVQKLENQSIIKYIEKDFEVTILNVDRTWATTKINAPMAWANGLTGKGVKIAVVDTGISLHPNLHVAGGVSFVSGRTSFIDDHGHGTHVAGIIGTHKSTLGNDGVAPGAALYAVKSLDHDGKGSLSAVIAGIEWAIDNNMDIINLSLGMSSNSKVLEEVINRAYNKGILVVAAAGNDGFSSSGNVMYPAKYNATIAVSAIDRENNRAPFSATGVEVEVTAPGLNVLSTNRSNSFGLMSGTSMASAFVSGSLALYMEKYPHLSNSELRKLIQVNAEDIGAAGRDSLFGFGIVQAPKTAAQPIGEVFESRIFVTENTVIYDTPSLSATRISTISPQNVTTLRKWGDWYEINTWLGPKWIKPNAPLAGGIDRISKTITLTKVTPIFDSPLDANHVSSLGAQTVTATHRWNDWYQINTWRGPKWVKPE